MMTETREQAEARYQELMKEIRELERRSFRALHPNTIREYEARIGRLQQEANIILR